MMKSATVRRGALDDALRIGAPLITVALVALYLLRHELAVDFQDQYWVVGHRLLTGGTPYDWTRAQIASGVGAFPYPALTAVAFVPFGPLPRGLAAAMWVALSLLAVAGTLRILRVRDWRLYPMVFLWWPVIIGWQSGNLTLVLLFGLALLWRHRDTPAAAGLIAALVISLKPFLWPVGLWLLATRRYAAAGWAILAGILVNLVAWSIVGFDQIPHYLHLDSAVTTALYRYGYGVISMAVRLGATRTAGTVVMIAISVLLAGHCVWLGRRGREAQALLVAVILTLAASPLSWMHYLALLIVPLAIVRPRLSVEWLLPLVLWLCPGGLQESGWQVALFALVTAAIAYRALRSPRTQPDHGPAPVSDQRRSGQAHVLATAQGGERAG